MSKVKSILISRKELLKVVPFSYVHIGRLERSGKFPKRLQIGANRVAWLASEVSEWIDAHAVNRDLELTQNGEAL